MRWSSETIRAFAAIGLGQVATALIGVVSLRLITELAPPHAFGVGNLLLAALGLGSHVFLGPMSNTVLRFYSENRVPADADRFAARAVIWSLAASGVFIAVWVFGLLMLRWQGDGQLGPVAYFAGAAWIIGTGLYNLAAAKIQARIFRVRFALLSVIYAAAVALLTAAALYVSPTADSFILGAALAIWLSVGAAALLGGVILPHSFSTRWNPAGFDQRLKSYGSHFVGMSIVNWLSNMADRFVLAAMLGTTATGNYVASFSIASRGMSLANAVCSDLFRAPLFDAANRKDHAAAERIFASWLALCVILTVAALTFILAFGQEIASILLAPEYRQGAVAIMTWVALAYGVYGVNSALEIRVLSISGSKPLAATMAIGGIANVVLAYAFIAWTGSVVAAAQASCASFAVQGLATATVLWLARRDASSGYPGRRLDDLGAR